MSISLSQMEEICFFSRNFGEQSTKGADTFLQHLQFDIIWNLSLSISNSFISLLKIK